MSDDTERERARYEALAALVDGYRRERDEAREQLYLTKREVGRWVDRETKAVRERDEARAEVWRLQEDRDKWRDRYHAMRTDAGLSVDVEDEITCAYRRGAEDMREACAREVLDYWGDGHEDARITADRIRDLPIPEDK